MAMTISARSVDGQRDSPRINDLTIGSVSLFKAALKGRFQLGKEPFRLEVVAQIELGSSAAGEDQRDQRQKKLAHD